MYLLCIVYFYMEISVRDICQFVNDSVIKIPFLSEMKKEKGKVQGQASPLSSTKTGWAKLEVYVPKVFTPIF